MASAFYWLAAACCLALAASKRQIDPRYAVNLTVFHVNPKNYSAAPVNMNSE